MKARFVNEDYPPGAEYDPKAPWNKPGWDEIVDINQYGEVELIKREYTEEEDWEEDKQIIDGNIMNQFLVKELELDFEKIEEEDIEIIEIENMPNRTYDILTTHGNINVSFEELENLI